MGVVTSRPDVRSSSRVLPLASTSDSSSPEIFDEYTRRQYVAKAPQRNPFGTDEEPRHFNDFDVFLKLKVLHQLSVWTLNNPERVKERMDEKDETQWRIEPLGWDRHGRTYLLLDDNRLYRMTHPKVPASTSKKAKSKSKKSQARRSSKRQKLDNSEAADANDGGAVESYDAESAEDDDSLGGAKWECLAITFEDYQSVLASVKSKDEDEIMLTERIREEVLPDIEKAAASKERREAKRLRELENLERMATAKRSSRLADKTARQKEIEQAQEAERRKHGEVIAAHKEQERQRKMEEARESRMMTREQRLKDREMRRILHEEELSRLERESQDGDSSTGAQRMSERHRKAEQERKQKELEELKAEMSHPDEHWDFDCSVCGAHGKDMDDGTHSIACEKCGVWQHSKCHGIREEDAEREDFHFDCDRCNKVNSIKLNFNKNEGEAHQPGLNGVVSGPPNPALKPAVMVPQPSQAPTNPPASPKKSNHDAYLARSQGKHPASTNLQPNGMSPIPLPPTTHQPTTGPSRPPTNDHNPYLNNFPRQSPHHPPSTPSLSATQGSTDVRFSPSTSGPARGPAAFSSPNATSYTPTSNHPALSAVSPVKHPPTATSPAVAAKSPPSAPRVNFQPPHPGTGISPVKHANASSPHTTGNHGYSGTSPPHATAPTTPGTAPGSALPQVGSAAGHMPASLPPGPALSPSVNASERAGVPVKKMTPEKVGGS